MFCNYLPRFFHNFLPEKILLIIILSWIISQTLLSYITLLPMYRPSTAYCKWCWIRCYSSIKSLLFTSECNHLCCSFAKSCPTPWPHGLKNARLSCPSLPPGLLKFMYVESVMPSNHLILCRPLLLLPSIFPSVRAFSNELALRIRWPKYFSFSTRTSNEYSGLISFRIDWFHLLAERDSQESSPTPQFESINSLVLNLVDFHKINLSTIRSIYKLC